MATSVASLATSPMVAVARWTRLRAIVFGRYPSSAAAARIRSSVSTDVFSLLASELQRWDYATIKKVDVLSTAVDGPRSATALILNGTTTDGRTMWINLIVHSENGQISTLR